MVAGLDEALLTMQTGGVRRLYIPGNLAFPKGLPAGELWGFLISSSRKFETIIRTERFHAVLLGQGHRPAGHDTALSAHSESRRPTPAPAAAGRPRVPPSSPVVFDVKLLYIPGISDADADE